MLLKQAAHTETKIFQASFRIKDTFFSIERQKCAKHDTEFPKVSTVVPAPNTADTLEEVTHSNISIPHHLK